MKKVYLCSLWKILLLGLTVFSIAVSCVEEHNDMNPENPDKPVDPDNPDKPGYGDMIVLRGKLQKGPFVSGARVKLDFFDEYMNPCQSSEHISNQMGGYEVSLSEPHRFVHIISQGDFFHEVTGKVESLEFPMIAFSECSDKKPINVNILTTLTADRIMNLIENGKNFESARNQAESEVLHFFNIKEDALQKLHFEDLDIMQPGEANAVLLGLSVQLLSAQTSQEFAFTMNRLISDFYPDGKVDDEELAAYVRNGSRCIDAEKVSENLKGWYESQGMDYSIPAFEDYLDVDGNGEPDKDQALIILGKDEFVLPAEGGEFEVEVSHNRELEVVIDNAAWISQDVSTKGPLTQSVLRFKVERNTEFDKRYGVVRIKDRSSDVSAEVKVTQVSAEALILAKDSYEIDRNGGSIEIGYQYTSSVDHEIDVDWMRTSATKSLESEVLNIQVDVNESVETREGHICFSMGEQKDTVTVYQTGGKVIVLSDKEVSLNSYYQTFTISVSSNIEYEMILPPVDWIFIYPSQNRAMVTNEYEFTVESNGPDDDREAEIVFQEVNGSLRETVKVFQSREHVIDAEKVYEVRYTGGTLEFPVGANFDYEASVVEGSDWMSLVSVKSMTTKVITLNVQPNRTDAARTGILRLSSPQVGDVDLQIFQNCDAEEVVVEVKKHGTLSQVISPEDLKAARKLKIIGLLNDDDFDYVDEYSKNMKVEELDLSGLESFTDILSDFSHLPQLYRVVMPKNVMTLAAGCLSYCPKLKEIIFPEDCIFSTFEGTGGNFISLWFSGPFNGCESLERVELPSSLEDLAAASFQDCIHLKEVVIPENVNIRELKATEAAHYNGISTAYWYCGFFNGCPEMKEFHIPASVEKIGHSTFKGFSSLERIEIPKGVTSIDTRNLFSGCTALESVVMPDVVTEIGDGMFSGCANLKSISPDLSKMTRFGDAAFAGASVESLYLSPDIEYGQGVYSGIPVEHLVIPDGIDTLKIDMFSGCEQLVSVDLGNVKIIEGCVFEDCSQLKSIVLPPSVRFVGGGVFSRSGLNEITIGSSELVLGASVFSETPMTELVIPNHVVSITGFVSNTSGGVEPLRGSDITSVVFEPGSRCETFGICGGGYIKEIELPASLKHLSASAFESCTVLREIVLPPSLETIGESAFYGSSIRTIDLPANVRSIGASAFGWSSLRELNIPEDSKLEHLSDCLFGDEMTDLYLKGGPVLTLEGSPFAGLETLYIGGSIETIVGADNYSGILNGPRRVVFLEDSKVTELQGPLFSRSSRYAYPESVTLNPGLRIIGDEVFKCYGGELIAGFENLESIGRESFAETSLTSLQFPALKKICSNAFKESSIKTLELPMVSELEKGAFAFSSVTRLELPSLKTVEYGMFEKVGLDYLGLPNAEVLGDKVFKDTNIKEFYLPKIRQVGTQSFYKCSMERLELPEAEVLADEAFYMSYIRSFHLPKVRKVGNRALDVSGYSDDPDNRTISLPSAEEIGPYAFSGGYWQHIDLPKVEVLGKNALSDVGDKYTENAPLPTFHLPNVRIMEAVAFSGTEVDRLDLPKLEILRSSAFSGSDIHTLNIPHVTTVEAHAFSGLKLGTLILPDLVNLETDAFYNLNATKLVLPSVKNIEEGVYGVFSRARLDTLQLDAVEQVSLSVFDCEKIGELHLPALKILEHGTVYNVQCLHIGSAIEKISYLALIDSGILFWRIDAPVPPAKLGGEYVDEAIPNHVVQEIRVPAESVELYKQTWPKCASVIVAQ